MPTPPYPVLQDVLNVVRTRVLDAIQTPAGAPAGQVGGEVFNDLLPATLVQVNAAWQKMQDALAAAGFSRLINTTTLSNVTAAATTDPGTFCYINWANYFDGTTLQSGPLLPQDLYPPLGLKERVHGGTGD